MPGPTQRSLTFRRRSLNATSHPAVVHGTLPQTCCSPERHRAVGGRFLALGNVVSTPSSIPYPGGFWRSHHALKENPVLLKSTVTALVALTALAGITSPSSAAPS